MRGNKTPYPIWIKFCMVVAIPDVITCANFGEDRLRGLGVAGGQSLPFSIDFDRRPYTLSHYRASVWLRSRHTQSAQCLHCCWHISVVDYWLVIQLNFAQTGGQIVMPVGIHGFVLVKFILCWMGSSSTDLEVLCFLIFIPMTDLMLVKLFEVSFGRTCQPAQHLS